MFYQLMHLLMFILKKFLKDFSIIYAPNHISSYLLLSQIHQKSFKTISILAYLNTIIHFFRILIYDSLKIFIDKIKKKNFQKIIKILTYKFSIKIKLVIFHIKI